jgi:hypothetical protein
MDTSLHATISRPKDLKEGETRIAGSNPAGERHSTMRGGEHGNF